MAIQKTLLYVEDDIDDREFFYDAMRVSHPGLKIISADNGQAALDYLKQAEKAGELPVLMVLDINLPVFDGKELMEKVMADPLLQHLPVVVFTSSESPLDRQWAESIGVSLYNKPYGINIMPAIVEDLLTYMR
jgi:CheY-like chemotaxis protein